MTTRSLASIESEFALLSPETQLSLLERLVHRTRVTLTGGRDWDDELTAMSDDPEVQRELGRLNNEFTAAEADGLEGR